MNTTFADWTFSESLEAEIKYLIDTHEDSRDPEDSEDGPLSRAQALQYLMQDCDRGEQCAAHEFKAELQAFGRAVGIYKHYTAEQLKNVFVSRGKKWDHKHNGEAFLFESWKPLGL